MSEESEINAEDAPPAFFEDADAPDQEKEEFRRLDARERPAASQEGSPDTTTAAANASIHRGSRYEDGTDELTADIGAPPVDQGNVEFEPPAAPSDQPGDDTTPATRSRSSQPVDGDPTALTEDEDAAGTTTRTTIERPDQPVPSAAEATAPAPRESALNAAAAGENQDEQPALNGSPLPSQSVPSAAADDAEFTPVAQAPAVVFSGTTGNEDEAISLDLGVALTDTDGNETLSITISGVPEGAQLSGGTDNGDGTWTLAPADLPGLTLTPPENFSGTISLGVTATATETTGQTAATTATADITVQSVADAPALETTDTFGNEDTAIALDVQSALTDTDGSETLSIRIRNIPNGSQLTLADGTQVTITGGTATLTPDQLSGLQLTPPADFSGDIALEIVASSTDGTDTATTSGTLNVSVTAVADAPTLELTDAAGSEDQAIALNIDAALTDSGETLSVTIGNIPEGSVLTLADGTTVAIVDGSASLTPDQLDGLNLTPPADFSGEIALNVAATSTDGTDTAVTSGTLSVSVTAVADAPVLNVADAGGLEDQAIALNIDAALTDAGETLSVSIGNIPEGSVLTLADGTVVPVTAGTATLTPDQLAGLNLTPPADFSGDIALDVTATSTDGTDTAATSGTMNVSVAAVADAPTLDLTDAVGAEDQAIALNIDAALTDSGETLSVTIGNIPEGAVLTLADGTQVTITGGTATLTPDQLAGLNLTPPTDFSGGIALDVTATSTDGTDTAVTSGTLNVSVTAVADAPVLNVTDATGAEDQAIVLNIDASLTDSGETLSVSISNIPEGSVLTLADGSTVTIAGGMATLSPDQLAGLSLTPPADFSGDIALDVVATSTDGTDTATTSGTLNVSVAAVADAPILDLTDATGAEDQAIALNIDAALTDSGETLSVSISNIPEGSVLTLANGSTVTIAGGTATLSPDQLTGLNLTPPADFSGDIALDVTATSTDGTDTATTSGTLNVNVTAVADAPVLNVADAAGLEYQAIALNIDAALTDAGETLSVSIGNIPEGSVLTLADGTVVPVTAGTATLTPDQLAGLNLTPPADFSGDIALDVTATSTDGTDTATTSGTLNVSVTAVADAPTLELTDAASSEDQAIALNIDAALTDSGETLSVTIGNIPEGSVLTLADGTTVAIVDGSVSLTPDQLTGLNLTPPADFAGDITLDVVATSTDGTDTAVTSGTLNVSVAAVADAPTLDLTDATGAEDQAIALNIDTALTDSGETLSVSISNIPEGSVLTLANGSTVTIAGGTATLTPDQLAGLNLTPPADFSGEIALDVTATSTDGTDTAATSGTLNVSVTAVADAPVLNVADTAGLEDQAIALNIDAALTDSGETLSVTIGNIPEGSVLTMADGTVVPVTGGTATLSPDQLTGLSLTPPTDFSGDIALEITATSTDGTDTAVTSGTLNVSVTAVADAPALETTDTVGNEDTAIALDIQSALMDTDGSETLSITLGNIPEGAVLTLADGTVVPVTGGTATLSPDQLTGLNLTPPTDFSGDIALDVVATSTDGTDTATTSGTLNVSVAAIADAPTLDLTDATGTEDQALLLDIDSSLIDNSEVLSVAIGDIPEGSILTTGDGTIIPIEAGVAILSPDQLTGLSLTPPANQSGLIDLTVSATSTDGSDTATTTEILNVSLSPVADGALLNVVDALGTEDQALLLDIDSSLIDNSEVLSIAIGDIPEGSILTTGDGTVIPIEAGVAILSPDQLTGLSLTPPANQSGLIELSVSATSTDGTDTATTTEILSVNLDPVADGALLNVVDALGTEDQALLLDIDSSLIDNSEVLSIAIGDIPEGSILTTGDGTVIPIEAGVAILSPDQLTGLSLTPPANQSGLIDLTVSATSTDGSDTATTTEILNVSLSPVADGALLNVVDALGTEDQALLLDIDSSLIDNSEVLSIAIGDIPEGSILTTGDGTVIPIEAGVAILSPDQLTGLSLTPPANQSGLIELSVSATSTDGTDTATTTEILSVNLDPVADGALLNVVDALGTEDQALLLDIDSSLIDNSEVLSVAIGDIPEGSILTTGDGTIIPIEAGVAILSPDQLTGLSLTPPANQSGLIDLSVSATSTDGTDTATTTEILSVNLDPVADGALLAVADVTGTEDQALLLDIDSSLIDNSEVLSVAIGDIPEGSILTTGDGTIIPIEAGVAILSPDQLTGLSLTPPANQSGLIELSVSATSTDGTDTATTTEILNISLSPVADAPILNVADVTGTENTPIALNIQAAVTDTDGSETVAVTIGNIPLGAVLSLADGTAVSTTGGMAILTPDQLGGLTITPPHDSDADFNLSVTTVSQDGTSTAMTSASIHVAVQGVADTPPLAVTVGAGTVSAVEIPSQSITIGQDNVTTSDNGFTVTARTLNSDGSLSEPSSDNISLNSSPAGFGVKGSASGAANELGFNTATGTSEELTIAFDGAVTGADVSLAWAHGSEQAHYEVYRDGEKVGEGTIQGVTDRIDAPVAISAADGGTFDSIVFSSPGHDHDYLINQVNFETAPGSYEIVDYPLTIATGLTDTDGSEQLSVTVSGLPDGAVLSAGTVNADGSVALTADDLDGLVLTAPAGTGNILLSVTSTATEADGASASISTQVSIDVAEPTMDGVADAPTLVVSDALGSEDTAITLDIQAALTDTDGSESLSVSVSNIPDGAVLALADGTEIPVNGGTATLNPDQLNGVKLTPPEDFSGSFDLQVAATSAEGSETNTVTGTLNVSVTPVADTPMLSAALGEPTVSTVGGTAVPTSITLDNYAALDAGYQVTARAINLDGSLTEAHAGNVSTGNGGIGVSGLASGSSYEIGHSLVHDVSEQLVVDFDSAITEASVSFDQASPLLMFFGGGKEQGHYDLYRDGEKVGEGDFTSSSWGGDGTYTAATVDGAGFDQIVFSAAKGYAGNESVNIGDGSDFIITQIDFTARVGGETIATYPLDITAALTDTDGSESLAVTIAGVPADAVLSAGTNNGDGSWTLDPDQLAGLNLTVPGTMETAFQLDITAQSTESDGGTATATTSVTVTPDGPQNAPEVSLGTTEFIQDFPIQPVSFAADAVLNDMDGSDISQAVVSISDGYHLGDILSVEGNTILDDLTGKTMISGTNIEVVGGGFDLTSNALTLQGADSLEAYQSVINSLTFNSLSPELIEGTRTISITVMDDTGLVSQTADLGVTLNDPLATDLFADGGTATSDPALAALSDPALAETTDPATDWLTATETETLSTLADEDATETALSDPTTSDSGLSSDPAISDTPELTTI